MQSYKEEKCHGVDIIKKKNIIIKGKLDKALGPDEEQKVMGAGSIHWLCLVFIFTKQYAFGGGQQILQLCVSSQNRFKAFSIGLFINYIIRQSFKYLKGMCLGEAGVKLIKSPGWSVLHWEVGRPWFSRGAPTSPRLFITTSKCSGCMPFGSWLRKTENEFILRNPNSNTGNAAWHFVMT